jgi:phosphatidate cytidylyltransferase
MYNFHPFLFPVLSIVGAVSAFGLLVAFTIIQWHRPTPEKRREMWLKLGILLTIVTVLIGGGAIGWMGLLPIMLFLAYCGWEELWSSTAPQADAIAVAKAPIAILPTVALFPGLGVLGVSNGLSGNAAVILCVNLAVMWLAIAVPLLGLGQPLSMQYGLTAILGTIGISIPLALLLALGCHDYGVYLFLILIVMGHDGFSEAFGRLCGRTPLCPNISPNKTVEGAIGGFISSVVLGGLLHFLVPNWWIWQVLMMAGMIALCSLLGDLSFSSLKRSLNIKDFGHRLAVTGGILDKFDGLLCAVPMVYAMTQWLGQ